MCQLKLSTNLVLLLMALLKGEKGTQRFEMIDIISHAVVVVAVKKSLWN
jgi:hypothetical protein